MLYYNVLHHGTISLAAARPRFLDYSMVLSRRFRFANHRKVQCQTSQAQVNGSHEPMIHEGVHRRGLEACLILTNLQDFFALPLR
jgi:hypothetical protein